MIETQVNGNGTEQVTGTFQEVALKVLGQKKVSSICRECGVTSGWTDWEISLAPVAIPLMPPAQGLYQSVLLLCKQCGYMRFYSLAYLGIKVEPRRIVTPN